MKKSLLFLLLFVAIIFTGCFNNSEKPNPGKDFKDSYESLNGKERNGKEYRKLDINEKNPFDEVNPSYIIDKMDNCQFSRCNYCYLVNLNHVKGIHKYDLTLDNDEVVLISRNRKKELMTDFSRFLGGSL